MHLNLIRTISFDVAGVSCSQQQFFRAKPRDSEVAEGGTVVISCEVANRHGRVQWTKDGLTLGKAQKISKTLALI